MAVKSAGVRKFLTERGWVEYPSPGFVAFERDGKEIAVFFWENAKHAKNAGIPSAYMVVVTPAGRLRVPQVEWDGHTSGERRTAKEVLEEFERIILAAYDEPSVAATHAWLEEVGQHPRYRLS